MFGDRRRGITPKKATHLHALSQPNARPINTRVITIAGTRIPFERINTIPGTSYQLLNETYPSLPPV